MPKAKRIYRELRTVGFSLKSKPPDTTIHYEPRDLCKYCKKVLSNRKKRLKRVFCSHRCANRYHGDRRVGTHRRSKDEIY